MTDGDPKAGAAHGKPSNHWLAVAGVALSALSCALHLYAAGAEPFIAFSWRDLALNVGLATVLFGLFALWAMACVRNFRRGPRPLLANGLLGVSVLWAAIHLFYLGATIYGYAQDMNNPILRALR